MEVFGNMPDRFSSCKIIIVILVFVTLSFSQLYSLAENSTKDDIQAEIKLEQEKLSKDMDEEKKEDEKSIQGVEKLPDITVIGQLQRIEYTVTRSSTATKTDTPVLVVPQTIMVVSKDLLEDRSAMNLHDVWQNIAGAYASLGEGYGNVINFRGFSSAHNLSQSTLYNGLRGGRGYFTIAPNLYNVDRVDVLKGPASIYGTTMPGGVANIISKKPQSISDNFLRLRKGSFDQLLTQIHSSGPTQKKNLFYLFDIGYEKSPKLHDNMDKQNVQFTSSLAWVLRDSTRFDFESGLLRIRRKSVPSHGVPIVNGDPFALPGTFNFTEPTDLTNMTNYYAEVHLNHKFADFLNLNMGMRAGNSNNDTTYHIMSGTPAADGTLKRGYSESSGEETPFSSDINITWNIDVAKILKNKVVFGSDFTSGKIKSSSISATEGVPSINVFKPVYGQANPKTYKYGSPSKLSAKDMRYGIYLQDEIELLSRTHVLLGMHAEKFSLDVNDLVKNQKFSEDDDAITLRGGLVYELIKDNLSVFASYSEGYEPQFFDRVMLPTQKGSPWAPEESWQVESGLKGSWKNNLNATISWFSIEKTNILDTDPVDKTLYRTIGAAESSGVEINIIGRPIANLNISLNYSNLYKAEVTKDTDPTQVGTRLYGTYKHQFSTWFRYDFRQLGIGFGTYYINGRPPVTPMTGGSAVELPDYWLFNTAIYYTFSRNLKLQLNIENLLNEKYLSGVRPTQGAPRNYSLSVTTGL